MDIICKSALQLGLIYAHKPFKIPTEDNFTPHRRSELEKFYLMKKSPKRISYNDMLTFDKIGQY